MISNKKSCEDLIGKTYGCIEIIREVEPRITRHNQRITQVECKCLLCGKSFLRDATRIRDGSTTGHRGCSPSRYTNSDMTQNIIGNMYGNWMVVDEFRSDKNNHFTRMCICECQCGSKILWTHRKYDILAGRTKGCKICSSKRGEGTSKSPNRYDLSGEYGIGYTDKNEPFYFDLEDYNLVKDYHWYIDNTGYVHSQYKENGKYIHIKMHRLVMQVVGDSEKIIDHIGHNPVDNRKTMLRICTQRENSFNHRPMTNKFNCNVTGVRKERNSWMAYIGIDNKVLHLGSFKNKEDAIAARKVAEEKYFGEYSYDASQEIAERNKIKE